MTKQIIGPRTRVGLAALPTIIAVALMRARFLFTPISADESGYLAIARAWGRNKVLYRDVWVDRPQVLVLVYRALWSIGLGTPVGVRLLGVGACLFGAVSCASIASTLAGPRACWITALCSGVLLSVPQYEGFAANAELLSGAVGASCLAVVLIATQSLERVDLRAMFAAGVIGGLAFGIKQSAFDAMTVAVIVTGWRAATTSQRGLWRATGALVVGWFIAIAGMAIHGAHTGWARWTYAVIGYRQQQRSFIVHANWQRLFETFGIVVPIVLPVVAVGATVCALRANHIRQEDTVIPALWLSLATFAFVIGGQFHRHYWVILMFPLGTFVGVVISTISDAFVRAMAVILALASPAHATFVAATMPRSRIGVLLESDGRFAKDEAFASWFRTHAAPGENIFALCAGVGLYGNISTDPPYPYLWFDGVEEIPGATSKLSELLSSDLRPTFVAQYQSPLACDRSGRTGAAISRFYRIATVLDGEPLYVRTDRRLRS